MVRGFKIVSISFLKFAFNSWKLPFTNVNLIAFMFILFKGPMGRLYRMRTYKLKLIRIKRYVLGNILHIDVIHTGNLRAEPRDWRKDICLQCGQKWILMLTVNFLPILANISHSHTSESLHNSYNLTHNNQ